MNNLFCRPLRLRATQIGIVAARALGEDARGIVQSVFERSAYVTLGDAWLCLGPPSLGAGPLNLLCEPWSAVLRCTSGTRVCFVQNELHLGDALVISLADAETWKPRSPLASSRKNLTHGLWALDAALPKSLPKEGLAALIRELPTAGHYAESLTENGRRGVRPSRLGLAEHPGSSPGQALRMREAETCTNVPHAEVRAQRASKHAPQHFQSDSQRHKENVAAAVRPAAEWLRQFVGGESGAGLCGLDVRLLTKVLGLGSGLTPSGDDFIGGAMVALTLLRQTRKRDALWAALSPNLARTTDISRAHLGAAAEGFGSAALHDLLDAVMAGAGGAIPPRLAAVAAIGHTSGWDALAGAACVLRAAAEAAGTPQCRSGLARHARGPE